MVTQCGDDHGVLRQHSCGGGGGHGALQSGGG